MQVFPKSQVAQCQLLESGENLSPKMISAEAGKVGGEGSGAVCGFQQVAQEGFPEKGTFEQRSEGGREPAQQGPGGESAGKREGKVKALS